MADEAEKNQVEQQHTPDQRPPAPEPEEEAPERSQDAPPTSNLQPPTSNTGRHDGALRRLWGRVTFAFAWICRPNEVGQPITLAPHGVRLLVLLVLGNLIVLVLLAVALYRSTTTPVLVQSIQSPAATETPAPSPILGPTPTPFGSGGAIALTLRRNSNADIYALNQVDRQLVRLTHDPAEDRDPDWSPDGNYIAFASNRAHNWDIYLLDLLSGALIRLTHDAAFDASPSWSPDGRWIAFESYRRGNLDIYVMSTTGQQIQRITTDPAPNYGPAWSPDSRAIAYTTFHDGNKDITVHVLDHSSVEEYEEEREQIINLTQSPDVDEDAPVWSPDGTRLAYVSGPRGNPSIQVTRFDWDALAADQTQSELFGAGTSPAWSPDGESLLYAYQRGAISHLVAASTTDWALFHEVYSVEGPLDGLTWTSLPLSPRVVARAEADAPPEEPAFYLELIQPTPTAGPSDAVFPPYALVSLPNMSTDEAGNPIENEGAADMLSDRVNESFNALRQRVIEEAGWDYLGSLSSTWRPMTYTPPSGQSRMSWHICGRAFGLEQDPYEVRSPRVELIREDLGNVTYWRVLIRAAEQDGSMGKPLREAVWDLNARDEGGRAMVEGGAPKTRIPSGYYVDFTTLAGDYGWERVPSLWRWRYFWADIRWWEFQKTNGMTWWDCMLEVFEPNEIEPVFGPIPGLED